VASALPTSSPVSAAPGTPAVFWLKTCLDEVVSSFAEPYRTAT
jgi:hypothetical protein